MLSSIEGIADSQWELSYLAVNINNLPTIYGDLLSKSTIITCPDGMKIQNVTVESTSNPIEVCGRTTILNNRIYVYIDALPSIITKFVLFIMTISTSGSLCPFCSLSMSLTRRLAPIVMTPFAYWQQVEWKSYSDTFQACLCYNTMLVCCGRFNAALGTVHVRI